MAGTPNPLLLIKRQIMAESRRIYNRGITDKAEHVTAVRVALMGAKIVSPKIVDALLDYLIAAIVSNRFEQNRDLDIAQPDFFEDLEYKFSLPGEKGKRKIIELRHVRLSDLDLIDVLKKANIDAVTAERDRWAAARDIVKPVMEANPKWNWERCVKYLRRRGMIS